MAKDLLNQPTHRVLLSMSVPVSLGMLSTILFQVVDTYFVGKLGAVPLTALSFASTIYFLLVGLFIGFSVAVSILVGKFVGQGNDSDIKRTATTAIMLSLIVPALLSIIGIIYIKPMFTFLGATNEVMPHIFAYMTPMFLGMPALAAGILIGTILRASGKVKLPEIVFGLAGILNLILDYLFIFGKAGFPAMGIRGVALGTVISWIFILFALSIVIIKDKRLSWIFPVSSATWQILSSLKRLAPPSILTQMIAPFTLIFITYLLGIHTSEAVAAYGIAGRVETLLMIGIMGVCTASTPFIAQNYGAKKITRIDEAIVFGGKAAFYLGLGLMILLLPFLKLIASLFSDNAMIIEYTLWYFYTVGASYVFYSLYLVTASIFNGLEMPSKTLKIMLVKTLIFTVPLTVIGAQFSVFGIFIGLALSNVAGGIYARFEMLKELKRVKSPLINRNPFTDMKNDFGLLIKRRFKNYR